MKTANLAKPRLWRYTVDEYDRLVRRKRLPRCAVELIEGRVIEMPPQMEPHAIGVILGGEITRRIFGAGFTVRQQMPLGVGKHSKPEPDISVVAGTARVPSYRSAHVRGFDHRD